MITIGGNRPAGWVYVASHPSTSGYTKIGYSKWHPFEPCIGYPKGFKRLHHLEFSLRAFGLGELRKWASPFHENAEGLEKQIRARLAKSRRTDVGTSREIFDLTHDEAVAIVEEYFP
jgi:hypothetical protein